MATKKTAIYAQQFPTAGINESKRAPGGKVTGDVGLAICKYTTDGTEATNDLINLVDLPDGCRVIPHLCKVVCEAGPAATFTAKVGDSGNDARYSTPVALAAGGQFDFAGATPAALDPFLLTDNTTVFATLTAVTTPAANKVVTFYIAYSAQN